MPGAACLDVSQLAGPPAAPVHVLQQDHAAELLTGIVLAVKEFGIAAVGARDSIASIALAGFAADWIRRLTGWRVTIIDAALPASTAVAEKWVREAVSSIGLVDSWTGPEQSQNLSPMGLNLPMPRP